MHCKRLEADNLIKCQGVKSKIITPDSCEEDDISTEFIAPATSAWLEEVVSENVDLNIHDDTIASEPNDQNNLAVHEDEDTD